MPKFITKSKAETQLLGRTLAEVLRPGDVVLLTGSLGAGKSEFARGVAKGLGVDGPVSSPTFTLLNIYQGRFVTLCHFDWFRIEGAEELISIGLDEFIPGEGIALIEWHERAPELIPPDCLEVLIEPLDEDMRVVTFLPRGAFRLAGLDIIPGLEVVDENPGA
jgi:tRNA threonylcarbamoyladenosine biosynthesis protein TsaE